MKAYCASCKEVVDAFWDVESDEIDQEFEVPLCGKCLTEINRCHGCGNWKSDNPNTPLGQTNGMCKTTKATAHAMDLACEFFKEEVSG